MAPLAAVTSVVVVIVLLLVLNGPARTSGAGPALQSTPPLPTVTPALTASSPSASASPRPTPTPRRTAPVAEPPATQKPAAAKIPVTVLNNSRIDNLAHQVAGELRAGHWPIRLVGNFTGRIAASTAYYGPGQRAAAWRLAHQFAAVQRVLPRFRGLPGSGLTLVVTRYWPH